jgi:hypothetical protein
MENSLGLSRRTSDAGQRDRHLKESASESTGG